jgi:hypothetical protein
LLKPIITLKHTAGQSWTLLPKLSLDRAGETEAPLEFRPGSVQGAFRRPERFLARCPAADEPLWWRNRAYESGSLGLPQSGAAVFAHFPQANIWGATGARSRVKAAFWNWARCSLHHAEDTYRSASVVFSVIEFAPI